MLSSVALVGSLACFTVLRESYNDVLPIRESIDKDFVIAASSELSDAVSMLTVLATGLVLGGGFFLANDGSFRTVLRSSPAQGFVFAIGSLLVFYFGFHARLGISEGLIHGTLDLEGVSRIVSRQALWLLIAASGLLGLIGASLMERDQS